MNLKRKVLVGSLWSVAGSSGYQVISFLLFIYMARILTPADVGIVALAMILIELLGALSRCGQVEALQREKSLSDLTTSTSLWMLAASGALMTALILAVALAFGEFTGTALFAAVLALLAPVCLLQALSAIPEAIMKREFRYATLSMRSWIATIAGGLVGISLAYRGYGVYALVWQRLATFIVQAIAVWVVLGWRPRRVFDRQEAKRLARTGMHIMLAGLTSMVTVRLTDLITGPMLGATQLGYLRVGWRVFHMFVQLSVLPVSDVALSTFSQVQDNLERLRRALLRMTQFVALASLPLLFGLGAVADLVVPLVLGSKWAGSVIVIQLLGFLMLPGTINFFFGSTMIAIGKAPIAFRLSIMQLPLAAILVFAGTFFGILGVMIAHITRASVVAIIILWILQRELGLSLRSMAGILLPPILATTVMVAAVELAKGVLPGDPSDVQRLIELVLIGASVYVGTLLLGDLVGLWRGYVRSAVESLAGAIALHRGAHVGTPT